MEPDRPPFWIFLLVAMPFDVAYCTGLYLQRWDVVTLGILWLLCMAIVAGAISLLKTLDAPDDFELPVDTL